MTTDNRAVTDSRNLASGWKREHPQADVPSFISEHAQLEDQSWHNDACPSFARKGLPHYEANDIRLWVDYADPKLRDMVEDNARFQVNRMNWITANCETLYEGEDMHKAVETLIQATDELKEAIATDSL